MPETKLEKLAKLVRYYILSSTTKAGSGHPTSSLSATDLTVGLMFGSNFRYDVKKPKFYNNDRLIFSKGHAAPLFYSLWAAAGQVSEKELLTLRKFNSRLEGHPAMAFPYTVAATGSLGQGLSAGVGLAVNAKYLDKLSYKTYVLLGDSELAEGQVWEAAEISSHYKLNNLVAIVDVNRLGQSGPTMAGYNLDSYVNKFKAFGWETIKIDGHNLTAILLAFKKAQASKGKPVAIIAKTIKGKGISFLENKNGWHGRALNAEEFRKAILELGKVDKNIKGQIKRPAAVKLKVTKFKKVTPKKYKLGEMVATRQAYGQTLAELFSKYPKIVSLDGETSNSTHAADFSKQFPKRYFEMYIAEQNMAGTSLGLSQAGKIPFVSTFAAFLSRAFDQIRMAQYSDANIKFVGSHAGVSIGQDGSSQMGLEELAMFRTILNSVVLYPSDAVSAQKIFELAAKQRGICYVQTTRMATPVIYKLSESFVIGGSKVVRQGQNDQVTLVGAGITLHEALKAYEILKKEKISIRVIDLYSIKPLDVVTLKKAANQTKTIITVEDHYAAGGLGEAVSSALSETGAKVKIMAVRKMPKSGAPEQLLNYEEISAEAIVRAVKKLLAK